MSQTAADTNTKIKEDGGGTKEQPQPQPQPQPQVYDEDSGVIRCICGFDDDDGFTIQCERCYVWQHAQCVDIDKGNVPDIYYCDQCDNRKLDVNKAIQRQKERVANENNELQHQHQQEVAASENPSGSSTATLASVSTNNTTANSTSAPAKRRRKTKQKTPDNGDGKDDSATPKQRTTSGGGSSNGKGRRLTEQNSKVTQEDNESDTEPDSRYYLSSASYQSYFRPVRECQVPNGLLSFWRNSVPELCKQHDENTTIFTEKEFETIQTAKANVKLLDARNKFHGFSKFGLFVENSVVRDRFIMEFVGNVMTCDEYKANPINQYCWFGCPKPGVLMMPHLNLCVDGRTVGSEASFIRRSCKPNVKVSPIIVLNQVHFGAFAVGAIKGGSELTMGWEWDPKHPAYKLSQGIDSDTFSKDEKYCLLQTYEMLIQRGMDCACGGNSDCILVQMRKIGRAKTPVPSKRPEGYSAREERKLAGAMAMIEKLEKEDPNSSSNKKRKRASDPELHTTLEKEKEAAALEPESTPLVPVQSLPTPGPPREMKDDTKSAKPQPMIESKAIQTEPVVKRLRSDGSVVNNSNKTFVAPRKTVMSRFLQARQEYKERPRPPPESIKSASSSPSPIATTVTSSQPQSSSSSVPTSGLFSKQYSLDFKVPAAPVSAASVATSSHSTAAGAAERSGSTTPTTPLSGQPISAPVMANALPSNIGTTTVKPKKKLSLADYKKKTQQKKE